MNNNRKFALNSGQNIIAEFTDEIIIPTRGLAIVALIGKSGFAKKVQLHGCYKKSFPTSS